MAGGKGRWALGFWRGWQIESGAERRALQGLRTGEAPSSSEAANDMVQPLAALRLHGNQTCR